MRCYKIGDLNIIANTEQEAQMIALIVHHSAPGCRRLIFIPKDGSTPVWADLSADCGFEIYVQNSDSVQYIGSLFGGTGQKILESAIDSMAGSQKMNQRFVNLKRRTQSKIRHDNDKERIEQFKKTIPNSAKSLFDSVMLGLDCRTDAYMIELIDSLEAGGVVIGSESWLPILRWFYNVVLMEEAKKLDGNRLTFFQLRSAFVTAASRIVKSGARSSNSMHLASKEDDIDWSDYAKEQG